jgi:hypothetical protein
MKKLPREPLGSREMTVDEIRLVADLRIMHSKVDELHQVVYNLKRRHKGDAVHKYADQDVLNDDIARVDEIYLWFLSLKESSSRQFGISRKR